MARYADEDDDEPRGRGSSKKDDKKNDLLEVRLENVRLSYPHIFKAQKYNGGDDDDGGTAAYSASFIIDPKKQKDLMDLCNDAVDEALYKEWGDKPPKMKDDKIAFRNDRDEEEYDGMWYVSARSGKRPKVVDRDKSPITADDGIIYGGCYVNAIVRFWAQNNKFGKRINCSLEAIQFVRDGEAFGAPPVDTDKAFDVVEGKSSRGGGRGRGRDEEDEDRPRRGRGKDRDEEPRGRGRSRDDDEEEAPRRGRGRDRDEDDAPRGRGRGRDEDDAPRRGRGRDDDDEPPRRSRRGEDDDEAPRRGRREL